MKKLLTIILCFVALNASAQKLVIGSQAPAIKTVKWIGGNYNPKAGNVILFYQASNASSVDQYNKLKEIVDNKQVGGVVITRDSDADGDALSYGGKIAVGYDSSGDVFKAYGVKYLPFMIGVNKEGKVVWLGNPNQ